jgi:hypothetical protein
VCVHSIAVLCCFSLFLPASRMQTTPDRCVFWEIPCWLAAWGSRLMLADRPRLAAGCWNGPLGSRLGEALTTHSSAGHSVARAHHSPPPLLRNSWDAQHSALAKHASLPPPPHPSQYSLHLLYASRIFTVPTPIQSTQLKSAPLSVIFQSCCSTLLLQLLHTRSSPVTLAHPSSWIDTDISQSPICFPLYLEQYI